MKKIWLLVLLLSAFLLASCSSYDMGYAPNYYVTTEDTTGETYAEIIENDFINAADMPVSTFSSDVDTASYTNIRRYLNDDMLPTKDAVRIEEMINYFQYDLDQPSGDEVIHVTSEYADAPWNDGHKLLMLGLSTKEIVYENTPGMNLVFLIDTSGSMSSSNKLPLLKEAFILLVEQLKPSDTISIVTYAGSAGVVLEAGDATNRQEIIDALDQLDSGGSTAGGAGIELAYKVAERNFITGGNNRIILATDGDFNVGMSNVNELEDFISLKKESGVFLSVLGFGDGNTRDDVMESLADHGNGVYYYIDSILEAEKVFVHELGASLVTVAKDVKLQIEFNPLNVKAYRLIGYENRMLDYQDFENDLKDAGDIGAGHQVIAFYEIIPSYSEEIIETKEFNKPEELRYDGTNLSEELANLAIRYKHPESDQSILIEAQSYISDYTNTPSETFRFASSVVEFGLLLRGSQFRSNSNFAHILSEAEATLGDDVYGYRQEFITLVQKAQILMD